MTAAGLGAVAAQQTVSERLVDALRDLGVRWAFGVSGGGVAPLWGALSRADGLRVVHTQHECGAAFCATEASLATGAPVVVFTTTGPGLTHALTGLVAARAEGARLIVLSGVTPAGRRRRGATQESGPTGPWPWLWADGGPFDLAGVAEHPDAVGPWLQQAAERLGGGGGCVLHLGLPMDVQGAWAAPLAVGAVRRAPAAPDAGAVRALAAELRAARVAVVVGHGARAAGAPLVALAEALDAPVVTTPRGKGAFPASHPLHRGVIGFAGHAEAEAALVGAERVLVLGSALGEGSSQYADALAGATLTLVDPSPAVQSGAFPGAAIERWALPVADVVGALLAELPPGPRMSRLPRRAPRGGARPGVVDPWGLLAAVQRQVVDGSDAWVMAESGNAFAFAIHALELDAPRLRVSVGWGSMGHFSSGAVGAALASGRPAVALVGDGAMLMMHEVATAARHQARVTWVVLNDGGYGMCRQGTRLAGVSGVDCELAPVDFTGLARCLGVEATRVDDVAALDRALAEAVRADGPRLIEVIVDREVAAPIAGRVRQLTWATEASR